MEQLSIEIIEHICYFLSIKDMASVALLNKYFYQFIRGNQFYTYCKKYLESNRKKYMINMMRNTTYFKRFILSNNSTKYNEMFFYYACIQGHLDTVIFLKMVVTPSSSCMVNAFQYACSSGHLSIARLLSKDSLDIPQGIYGILAFRSACLNGHVEVAKWLIKMCPQIREHKSLGEIFYGTCKNGHLSVAKVLVGNFDIDTDLDLIFRQVCANGHIELAQWLVEIYSDINFHTKDDYAFRLACANGHLDTAVWLKSICPKINMHAKNDYAMQKAKVNNHTLIVAWLESEIIKTTPKYYWILNIFSCN